MGQNNTGDGDGTTRPDSARINEAIDRHVSIETREKLMADALAPAPSSLGQRLLDNTVDGVRKIPAGFMHSLNPEHILPNVAIGAVIGVGTKTLLPAGGPVGKIAGVALGAVFIGKPLAESYYTAGTATNMMQMDHASTTLGDMVGGLPVAMVEGGVGAKLGSMAAGKALGTAALKPYVNWRDAQWAKLDTKFDAAESGIRNIAFQQLNIGRPVMHSHQGHRAGVVPPYLLEELARTSKDMKWIETGIKSESLAGGMKPRQGDGFLGPQDFKGAREIFDAKNTETQGTLIRSEGQPKTGKLDADKVYDYSGDVRQFYTEVHGRNSIDGKGMKMKSTVNFGKDYENAHWDGEGMFYGSPGPKSPFKTFTLRDITGHEIAHGVTEMEAALVYRNQPGALNEHLSDVFGALVQQRVMGHSAKQASWLVGEGIWKDNVKGRALRDMRNPGTAYDDMAIGKDPQPAHMKDYNTTRSDNGGVHYNSGIPNRAFVLFSEAVGGNAWEVPGKIWYEARAKAGSRPSFAQFAFETVEAAKRLGHPESVAKLEKAWGDVGIKPSKTDASIDVTPVVIGGVGTDNLRNR